MAHFVIEQLSFSYPETDHPALDGIDLSIEQGEYVTICGKSGCGKTTLLRQLKTALTPHGERTGHILYDGVPIEQVDARTQSQAIGFVMQNPESQIVTDKVWHELAFGLESLGCDQKTMRLRVAEMASYFGIQNWFHKDVRELSGGQKQLLNLASIMAMQPSILVLDEPTSQLDPIAASDFLNTIRKINLELGTTIILTEHRLEEVFAVADRVIVMEDGHIIADAAPREVGALLNSRDDDMFASLPAPMRIYYSVGDKTFPCPLTVREGRTWLSDMFDYKGEEPRELEYEQVDPLDIDYADAAVFAKELWFRYEKDAPDVLRGVDLVVPKGALYAIVGGNGTGKSTTLKALAGTIYPYRGKLTIMGNKLDRKKRGTDTLGLITMLPQDPQNVFVEKTVRKDLLEMLSDSREPIEQQQQRIIEMARLVEIEHLLDRHPFDLSGGEQQRAALAKVLLTNPQVLLLDEPTKGLDCAFKRRLAAILAKLKAAGVTIIMSSHDVEFCAQYADIVAMFFDGSVVSAHTPRRFFAQNSFYTTAANRMSRHLCTNAVVDEEVVLLCKQK